MNQVGSWIQQEHLTMPDFSNALHDGWRGFVQKSAPSATLVLYPSAIASEFWSYALLRNRFEVRAEAVANYREKERIGAFLRNHPSGQIVVIDDGAYSGTTKRIEIEGIRRTLKSLGSEKKPMLVLGCATKEAIDRLSSSPALGGLYVGREIPTVKTKLQQLEHRLPRRRFRRLLERYIHLFAFRDDRFLTATDFVQMVRSGASVAKLAHEDSEGTLQLDKSVTTLPHKSPDGQSNLSPPDFRTYGVERGKILTTEARSPRYSPLRRPVHRPYREIDGWWRASPRQPQGTQRRSRLRRPRLRFGGGRGSP